MAPLLARRRRHRSRQGRLDHRRSAAAAGYTVSRTPVDGAEVQTTGGSYYGHVGVVTGVNADGSVTISDMNGIAGWGRVGSKTISAEEASRYNYIYPR